MLKHEWVELAEERAKEILRLEQEIARLRKLWQQARDNASRLKYPDNSGG
jgi:hypothetical protein